MTLYPSYFIRHFCIKPHVKKRIFFCWSIVLYVNWTCTTLSVFSEILTTDWLDDVNFPRPYVPIKFKESKHDFTQWCLAVLNEKNFPKVCLADWVSLRPRLLNKGKWHQSYFSVGGHSLHWTPSSSGSVFQNSVRQVLDLNLI